MVVLKEGDKEVKIFLSGPLLVTLNKITGEVNIKPVTVPVPEVKEEADKDKIALQEAFSRGFAILALNKVAPAIEAPEPVTAARENVYRTTLEFLRDHSEDELTILVNTNSRDILATANFENVPPAYLMPVLEILKEEMRRAIIDYRNPPRRNP